MLIWLGIRRWFPDIQFGRRKQLIQTYHAQQVMNNYAMAEVKHIIGVVIMISCLMQISALFMIVGHGADAGVFMVTAVGATFLLAFVLTAFCLKMASEMQVLSSGFLQSFLRNDLTMTSFQRRRMKASRPLHIEAGSFEIGRAHV